MLPLLNLHVLPENQVISSFDSWCRFVSDSEETDPLYRAALDWVWSYSRRARSLEEKRGERLLRMARMRALLGLLDNPQQAYPSVLVAGTKGKGSTVAYIDAAMRAGGRRVARYTSPHLRNWRERTTINGDAVGVKAATATLDKVRTAVGRLDPWLGVPNTFEIGTCFAFFEFALRGVDLAVVEVGVGGLYDATNVLEPLVSAIAPVSFDHMEALGSTLTTIAAHKAGVMRPGRTAVLAPQPAEADAEIARAAERIGTRLVRVGRDWTWNITHRDEVDHAQPTTIRGPGGWQLPPVLLGLAGNHQRDNATAAVAAVTEIGLADGRLAVERLAIASGLASVCWPGRLQVISRRPTMVLDGAHNGASARALAEALRALFVWERLHLVIGMSAEKDYRAVIAELGPLASEVIATRSLHDRSISPHDLARIASEVVPDVAIRVADDGVVDAMKQAIARATPDDLVLVTGSLFVVGEAL